MRLGYAREGSTQNRTWYTPGVRARKEGTLVSVYSLPELPYDYAALEPHISGKIMELHHD
ncbi:iron/manganese superoxide dismutase-like protein, partial [Rhodococcus sp. OK611]